jgi:hypothetical protein
MPDIESAVCAEFRRKPAKPRECSAAKALEETPIMKDRGERAALG